MMSARPRSVLIQLNFRKPKRLSETVKRMMPSTTKQKEELTVRSQRARQFIVSTARMPMQGTKMILLGSLSHSDWQFPSRATPITIYAAQRSLRQNFFMTLTCSPMLKPKMQSMCAAIKKQVPTMKADISLDIRRTSPTRERAMPASMTRGTRCCRTLFLSWMQMTMRMIGMGFSICRGQIRKPSPNTQRSATRRMAKWRSGSYLRRVPLFNLCTSFFRSIMLLIWVVMGNHRGWLWAITGGGAGCPAGS